MSAEMPSSADVLVVGAGPTGLTAAAFLERLGLEVVCVDSQPAISEEPKGNCVQARTLEMFESVGLTDTLIETGQIATEAVSYFPLAQCRRWAGWIIAGRWQPRFAIAPEFEAEAAKSWKDLAGP